MQSDVTAEHTSGEEHEPGTGDAVAGSPPPHAKVVDRSARRRRFATVVFCVLMAGWVVVFLASGSLTRGPSPKNLGGDFVLFLSAAKVQQAGGNPYDQVVLYRAERRFLRRDGITPPAFDPYMRVGNPSLLFWILRPLTGLPFTVSGAIWCGAMYALLALGCWGCLMRMRWRRRRLPLVVFLAFPQTIYAAYYGNVDGLVFAGLAWAAALAATRPMIAGALLTAAFLKPQVALPGALLIVLFLSPSRLRTIAGFAAASMAALVLTFLTTGVQSVGWWLQALGGYSQRLGVQPDIASLSGLYVYSATDRVRLFLEGVSLLAVVGATIFWWWRQRARIDLDVLGIAWLWVAWFLATPFAHFHDEVVLALPMIALLGRDGRWLGGWPAAVALYVLFLSVLLFPPTRAHTDFQSLTLLVVMACALVQLSRSRNNPHSAAIGRAEAAPALFSG